MEPLALPSGERPIDHPPDVLALFPRQYGISPPYLLPPEFSSNTFSANTVNGFPMRLSPFFWKKTHQPDSTDSEKLDVSNLDVDLPPPEAQTPVLPWFKNPDSWRWGRYLALGLVANAGIWGMTVTYLKHTPFIFSSNWSLVLPTGSQGISLNLPEIGQTTTSSGSPFGQTSFDPRASYKYIVTSHPVLEEAAKLVGLSVKEFGTPRIKLLNNTTIMEFSVTGKSPKEAQRKAKALYEAMVNQLNALRTGESDSRSAVTKTSLRSAQDKLEKAQKRLSNYKADSGLSSPDQVRNLSANIETLRRQRAELAAQRDQSHARLTTLTSTMGLSPEQATDALLLQVDHPFQQLLKSYTEATTTLTTYTSKWGPNHPSVIREQAHQQAAAQAVIDRGSQLLGKPVNPSQLSRLSLDAGGSSSNRATLLQQMISLNSDLYGLTSEVTSLDEQISGLEAQLQDLAQKESTYDNLNRDVQISEAIFASTLAKTDLSKSDIFSSYPLVQLIEEPSLPEKPTAPKVKLAYAGAGMGSVFVSTGLTVLWWRKRLLEKYRRLHEQKEKSV